MKSRWLNVVALWLGCTAACVDGQDAQTSSATAARTESSSPAVVRGLDTVQLGAAVKHGHHYIVAIGIDHYQNWPVLNSAVSDATGFARMLTDKFGFENAVEPLTEKNATRDNINSLIDDDLRSRLKPEDDLVIFFAGHGTTRSDKIGEETTSVGFLVPFEARAPGAVEHWSDYIGIGDFLQMVSTLQPYHILVILDSCHSGIALGSRFSMNRVGTRFEQDMQSKVSRKIIASAQHDQLAADGGGPVPGHSLFTGHMINGLSTGQVDRFNQGFITATQLGAYTQHEVAVAAGSRQTPIFGAFDLDAGGELIIPLGAGTAPRSQSASGNSAGALNEREVNEVARIRKDGRRYWVDDDAQKNFPAARSATLNLCGTGDGWACAQVADSFRLGLGGHADFTRAVELAQKGCQAHTAEACMILGKLYETGETILPDLPSAFLMYLEACRGGELVGCSDLGAMYRSGRGVGRDPVQAALLYRRTCDSGDLKGCSDLGTMLENGEGVEKKDATEAMALYRKACDGGEMLGCINLGTTYRNGQGVEKNAARAVAFFQKSCDAGSFAGCGDLGEMYRNGEGVEKDILKAESLYRKACDGGDTGACAYFKSRK